MHTLSVISNKGGSGKTLISFLIAGAIKKRHPKARVLFIDLTQDQGSRSISLAPDQERRGLGMGRALTPLVMADGNEERMAQAAGEGAAILRQAIQPVCVVPGIGEKGVIGFAPAASADLDKLAEGTWNKTTSPEEALASLLAEIEAEWDWVVIDTPGALNSPAVRAAMPISDAVVIPCDARVTETLAGLEKVFTAVRKIQKAGLDVNLAGLIGNMVVPTAASRETIQTLKDVGAARGIPVLAWIDHVTTASNALRAYNVEVDGRAMRGGGLYFESAMAVGSTARKAETLAQQFEAVAESLMEAARHKTPASA
jgi:cellulose biosynthesis protein BcsQ